MVLTPLSYALPLLLISGVASYGEHGHSEHECFNCPADTYQDEEGSTGCKGCPAHSTSPETSDAKSDCECKPGYESDDGGVNGHADGHECVACPKMEFKTPTGAGACLRCNWLPCFFPLTHSFFARMLFERTS